MAIPKHIRLEFVTPERAVVHDDVDELELPGDRFDRSVVHVTRGSGRPEAPDRPGAPRDTTLWI